MHARALPEQARRKHARIVQHQAIAGAQKRGQIAELPVLPALPRAIHHQHARSGAVGERRLRDQLPRQGKIEFGSAKGIHPCRASEHPFRFTVAETTCPALRLPTAPADTRPARTPGRTARECAPRAPATAPCSRGPDKRSRRTASGKGRPASGSAAPGTERKSSVREGIRNSGPPPKYCAPASRAARGQGVEAFLGIGDHRQDGIRKNACVQAGSRQRFGPPPAADRAAARAVPSVAPGAGSSVVTVMLTDNTLRRAISRNRSISRATRSDLVVIERCRPFSLAKTSRMARVRPKRRSAG